MSCANSDMSLEADGRITSGSIIHSSSARGTIAIRGVRNFKCRSTVANVDLRHSVLHAVPRGVYRRANTEHWSLRVKCSLCHFFSLRQTVPGRHTAARQSQDQLHDACCHLTNMIEKRCHLFPNYFRPC